MAAPITADALAARLAAGATAGTVHVVGLTGSVAAGKSTLAAQIAAALAPEHRVEIVATDAWLLPNAVLDARGLTLRKGYPESYDTVALAALPAAIRRGPVTVPGYSHVIYDTDPALARTIEPPDVLILEGLGFAGAVAGAVDSLVYLDAAEDDLEHWFLERFMGFWHAAADDPASFYTRFRSMDAAGARDFAGWSGRRSTCPICATISRRCCGRRIWWCERRAIMRWRWCGVSVRWYRDRAEPAHPERSRGTCRPCPGVPRLRSG